jgi:gluconate 2-dehydrogenase gamma chain
MSYPGLDRRALLKFGGGLWASALLGANMPAVAAAAATAREQASYRSLSPALGAALDAAAARILPTTDTPGAREAGAVWFMDAMLAGDMAKAMPLMEAGVAQLDGAAGGSFADLPDARQDELLREIEDGEFFGLLRFLTLAGTFTMSKYGGNRGKVGWDILGFERRHSWEAPFGHYDRGMHGKEAGAE